MKRHELTDEQWAVVAPLITRSAAKMGRPALDRRSVACMRKLLLLLNSMLKQDKTWDQFIHKIKSELTPDLYWLLTRSLLVVSH